MTPGMLHKIYLGLFILAAAGGGFQYVKNLGTIETERDQYETALWATSEAMGRQAEETAEELNAYKQAAEVLSQQFQEARDARDEAVREVAMLDITKQGKDDPAGLEHDINEWTSWVFDEIKAASVDSRNRDPDTARPPTP